MKLILDTDPGVDDAMAYFYALQSPGVELLAMTTIFGNVTTEIATGNALWLTEFSGHDIPVIRGSERPLVMPPKEPFSEVHGPFGFGALRKTPKGATPSSEEAAQFLVDMARKYKGELTICPVGPLTNIAKAVLIDPCFVENLKQLVIMGGSLRAGGNVTDYADANFWNDPHAANVVLTAPGGGQISIIGLDVTNSINMIPAQFGDLAKASEEAGGFLKTIAEFYMDFYQRRSGIFECAIHDPVAVIACEAPELFSFEEHALRVVTEGEKIGMMTANDAPGARVCKVSTDAQRERIVSQFLDIAGRNP